MAAGELFRFRTVRSIQHKQEGFTAHTVTPSKGLEGSKNHGPVPAGTYPWLITLSDALATAGDSLSPAAVLSLLPSDWTTQVGTDAWRAYVQSLVDRLGVLALDVKKIGAEQNNYGITLVPQAFTRRIELLCRQILLCDCIETLLADQSLPQSQRRLQTAADVKVALSFRTVALPSLYFNGTPPVIARAPGVTDLSVVKNEWNRYIPGQLANVVNVLPGETFDGVVKHMEETVQAQSTTTTQSTSQTTENSQTNSTTLATASSADASTNIGVHGQVEVSGSYGPTTVKTTLGAQAQFSKSSSSNTSLTNSVETVARAVKTVSQTISQMQSMRSTVRDSSRQEHKLQNTTTDVMVGQYRWLSEVHRVQLVNYPNRLVIEFELPEPGAWLRWALANQPTTPTMNPNPGMFAVNKNDPRLDPGDPKQGDSTATRLTPADITPEIAAGLAGRWMVQGLTPPPAATLTMGKSFAITAAPLQLSDNSLSVPDGYVATNWSMDVSTVGADDNGNHPTDVRVAVGGSGATFETASTQTATFLASNQTGLSVGSFNTGTVPIYVYGSFLAGGAGITVNVQVNCAQINADGNGNGQPYVNWQIATFNLLAGAYLKLLNAYNQEQAARQQSQAQSGSITVGPPSLNLSRAVAELKRLAIQNLLGQTFTGYDLLKPQGVAAFGSQEPSVNPPDTVTSSPVIQFFEQVFEWENIVYICYPYFWGGHTRWVNNATNATADPVFDQFLNAGSCRLVVPVRPGMEQLVNYFLYTSCIWSGSNPPGPNDANYLSVADEIQSIQVGATDGTPIYPPWEVVLPTTLLWAGTDPSKLPVNEAATIPAPPIPPASVALDIHASANPCVYGQPVTITATLSGATTGGAVPTGQVNIIVDGTKTADSPLNLDAIGSATCAPLEGLNVGTHAISVEYLGDAIFGAALANLPTLTVSQASVSITVTSSANPSQANRPVKFTAVVSAASPGTGTPTGQVSFVVDGAQTADSPVDLNSGGSATSAPVRGLPSGAHRVSVVYLGDANFASNTGNLPTQTVN